MRSLMIIVCLFVGFISAALSNKIKNASVTYNEITRKFEFHDFISPDAVAHASFQDEIFLTGWSYLDLKTSEQYPDHVQAYAAGLVEGYLTADLLEKHWINTVSEYCIHEEPYCKRLSIFLQKNLNFLNQNIKMKRSHDDYWHHIALTLEQIKGLQDGFKNITDQPSTEIDVMGFLRFNLMGDLLDLEKVLHKKQQRPLGSGSCSALIKVLPGIKDLYVAHNTWTYYNTMLRILKKYSLMFHITMEKGSPIIPGHTSTFSSYPGMIFSGDDFYIVSSGMAILETTISNYNASLWKYVTAEGNVLEWQRNIVANRLATNGEDWMKWFTITNSGTYNNQWMIVDYKTFVPGHPLKDGLLWVLEQLPGYVHFEDKTDVLRKQGYWPSYNRPYYKDIFNMSAMPTNVDKYGDWFTYERTPRALIFKRDQEKVIDLDSMIKLMRYNDYTKDPLSRCNCTPPYSAYNAIAARSDLNPANGTYSIDALGHDALGATDLKITNAKLFHQYKFVAIGGPTYDPLPPFQWSKTDFDKTVKHEGHPDLWQFKPIIHNWM